MHEVKTRNKRETKTHIDLGLFLGILVLFIFGIVVLYSASYYHGLTQMQEADPTHFVKKQFLIGTVSLFGMLFVGYKFDYRILKNIKIAWFLYFISIGLLLSLYVIGVESKGATRWIPLPFGLNFQPSEIAKIAVIIMISAFIVKHKNEMNRLIRVIQAWLIVLIPSVLIAMENLSSGIVVAFVGAVIIFMGSPKVWFYYVLAFIAIFLVAGLVLTIFNTPPDQELGGFLGKILKGYRLERIRVWQDPWRDASVGGYQPIQALYAIASGGLWGSGLGNGMQKLGFLPEPHNDVIFSVIAEELGVLGIGFLFVLYSIIIFRGFSIAFKCNDFFGALVAVGISVLVGIQVIINACVNTNIMPTTGMQLPLVSYGGTALVILLGTLGILLNISFHVNKTKKD